MEDHLIKATAPGVRAFAAVTTRLTEEARRRHNAYPAAIAALGRAMTGALLLAANLKTEESVTLRIAGDGPLGEIVADASPSGAARGYARNPAADPPLKDGKLDVGGAVGRGMLHVTRFTGLKHPFTGSCRLVSGEIAEDITHYLAVSEQTPSSVGLGVLVGRQAAVAAAGGFLIQALPDADGAAIDALETNIGRLPPLSDLIEKGADAAEIIGRLFWGLEAKYHARTPLAFACRCSRAKIERVLISLGRGELMSMIDEGRAEITCHFCGEQYRLNREELQAALAKLPRQ